MINITNTIVIFEFKAEADLWNSDAFSFVVPNNTTFWYKDEGCTILQGIVKMVFLSISYYKKSLQNIMKVQKNLQQFILPIYKANITL